MAMVFNAEEVLQMAEQIERNGARFYRRAAEIVKDARVNKLLLELAAWEDGHEKIFAAMRARLSDREREPTVFDPEHEGGLYLRAMADGHVFEVKKDPAALLTGKETAGEILKQAIDKEKDSIIFYLGLTEFAPETLGREKIEGIIREEMRHIGYLNRHIGSLR
jgi:rubrerythrin